MDPFDLRIWPNFVQAGGDASSAAIVEQIVIDSRRISTPHSLFVALKGSQDGHRFLPDVAQAGARYALVSKDWVGANKLDRLTLLRVENPLEAFQEIAALYRRQLQHTTILAITGSYGKTLLKDLLLALLSTCKHTAASPESFNSQIGVPLSLLTIKKKDQVAIIEAGISQKGEMDRLAYMIYPDCSILTTIGDAHLPTLQTLETTAEEKIKLLTYNPQAQWNLLPNSALVRPWLSRFHAKYHFWDERNPTLPHAASLSASSHEVVPYRMHFPDGQQLDREMTSGFSYFLDLVNMAIKAAWLLGVPLEAIGSVLKDYQLELMRTEIWKAPLGTTFINDPYCSDSQSVVNALKQLEQASATQRKVFAFGGIRGEPSSHAYHHIGKEIAKSKIDLLFLYGQKDYASLVKEMTEESPHTEILFSNTFRETVEQMRDHLRQDDFVLIKGERKEPIHKIAEAFNESICNNQCLINLSAIRTNLNIIRNKLLPKTRIMCMVKALAYGTDDVRVAKFLSSCQIDILGVSYVDEGVALRRSGVTQSIFVINAAHYEVAKVLSWDLEIGIHDSQMIDEVAREATEKKKVVKVHLHVDTGMSRFGCRPNEALQLAQKIQAHPSLELVGIFTHFAAAENPDEDAFSFSQVQQFDQVIQELESHHIYPKWKHAANSSAVMRFTLPQYNMVRLGLAVYGLYPSEASKKALPLRLALSLISHIVGINVCKQGETISYGRSYTVTREQQIIAVLPIGYFDGLHRNYSGKGEVMIRGIKVPMVGKICMDFMMVDITEIPEAKVGDPVLIFGTDEHGNYLSPENLANKGESIVYELVTCLGPRIQRIFVND